MKKNLEKDFEYYLANQSDLVGKFNGRVLVIKNQKVVGDYDSEMAALNAASAKYELGTFLIQLCEPGEESTTQTFHSRVCFA